jgi:transposase
MRFVAIKSIERQAARGVERARELLVKQRTQLMNCLRSQLAEFGIIAAPGGRGFAELSALLQTKCQCRQILLAQRGPSIHDNNLRRHCGAAKQSRCNDAVLNCQMSYH